MRFPSEAPATGKSGGWEVPPTSHLRGDRNTGGGPRAEALRTPASVDPEGEDAIEAGTGENPSTHHGEKGEPECARTRSLPSWGRPKRPATSACGWSSTARPSADGAKWRVDSWRRPSRPCFGAGRASGILPARWTYGSSSPPARTSGASWKMNHSKHCGCRWMCLRGGRSRRPGEVREEGANLDQS